MICPVCKKELVIFKNDVWINNQGYRVEILDYGREDIWLLYIENQNKVAWKIKDFLEMYSKEVL
jgi:hypothetical protein